MRLVVRFSRALARFWLIGAIVTGLFIDVGVDVSILRVAHTEQRPAVIVLIYRNITPIADILHTARKVPYLKFRYGLDMHKENRIVFKYLEL